MSSFNLKKVKLRGAKLPWYIYNETNFILITSPTIPTTVEDKKNIIFAESTVMGLNYTPITPARNGNRTVSFSLPIIKRTPNSAFGNTGIMAAFEMLRNNDNPSLMSLFGANQFNPNPKVIYHWGTHTLLPQEYFVKRCDFSHDTRFVTKTGHTEYSIVNMELELDENSLLYEAERVVRVINARKGLVDSVSQILSMKGRPY